MAIISGQDKSDLDGRMGTKAFAACSEWFISGRGMEGRTLAFDIAILKERSACFRGNSQGHLCSFAYLEMAHSDVSPDAASVQELP
jgi:hypothetical protein